MLVHDPHAMPWAWRASVNTDVAGNVEYTPWNDVVWGWKARSANRCCSEPPMRSICKKYSRSTDEERTQKGTDGELEPSTPASLHRHGKPFTSLDSAASTAFGETWSVVSASEDESDHESTVSVARTSSPDAWYVPPLQETLPYASEPFVQPSKKQMSPQGDSSARPAQPSEQSAQQSQQARTTGGSAPQPQPCQTHVVYVPYPVPVQVQQQAVSDVLNASSCQWQKILAGTSNGWQLPSTAVPKLSSDASQRVPAVASMDAAKHVYQVEFDMETDGFPEDHGWTRSISEPATMQSSEGKARGRALLSTMPPAFPHSPCPRQSTNFGLAPCPGVPNKAKAMGMKERGTCGAGSQLEQKAVGRPMPPRWCWSIGSTGHPLHCAAACKYATKGKCKDGEYCDRCHMCTWTAAQRKHYQNQRRYHQ